MVASRVRADEVVRVREEIDSVLAHPGQSLETLHADTDRDRLFVAEAAVACGLAGRGLGERLPFG